jgi:hypothetical protein
MSLNTNYLQFSNCKLPQFLDVDEKNDLSSLLHIILRFGGF